VSGTRERDLHLPPGGAAAPFREAALEAASNTAAQTDRQEYATAYDENLADPVRAVIGDEPVGE
jgi:hypothetical protein